MTATILAFPNHMDPVGAIRALEEKTGLVAVPCRTFVRLVPRSPDAAANVVAFVPGAGFIPAFLRVEAKPFYFDADGGAA